MFCYGMHAMLQSCHELDCFTNYYVMNNNNIISDFTAVVKVINRLVEIILYIILF